MSDPPKPPLPPTTILPAVPAGSLPEAPSPLPPTTILPAVGAAPPPPAGIRWRARIPVVTNPLLLRDGLLALGCPTVVLAVILVVATGGENLLAMLGLAAVCGAVVLVLGLSVAVVMQILGVDAEFWVDDRGVGAAMGRRGRALDGAAVVGGVLGSSASAIGAGLLARSMEDRSIAWDEIRSARVHARSRTVYVRPRSLIGPVALHCTRENFEAVVRWIAERADPAVLTGDVPRR